MKTTSILIQEIVVLITIFTDEKRSPDKSKVGIEIGSVHHIAFDVSSAEFLPDY